MRLFYDEPHNIIQVLDENYKVEYHHYPIKNHPAKIIASMSMNMIENQATKQLEKGRIFCSKGNLISEWSHLRIGTDETLLDLMELYSHTSTREVSLIDFPNFGPVLYDVVMQFLAPFLAILI